MDCFVDYRRVFSDKQPKAKGRRRHGGLVDQDRREVRCIYQIYLSIFKDQTSQSECKTYLGHHPCTMAANQTCSG